MARHFRRSLFVFVCVLPLTSTVSRTTAGFRAAVAGRPPAKGAAAPAIFRRSASQRRHEWQRRRVEPRPIRSAHQSASRTSLDGVLGGRSGLRRRDHVDFGRLDHCAGGAGHATGTRELNADRRNLRVCLPRRGRRNRRRKQSRGKTNAPHGSPPSIDDDRLFARINAPIYH